MFKDKLCVVTGGTGFIGHNLVERLVKEGARVKVLDNMLTGRRENINLSAEYWDLDIREKESVIRGLRDADYVFHTAALARIQWTMHDPVLCHEINATGTLNVLEACLENEVPRLIYSSTCSVRVPGTPYYVSKLCAEEYVTTYTKLYHLSAISLRYFTVYGEDQSMEGKHPNVIASLRKSYKDTGRLWITGDGTQSRDYVHVSDVVEANILAAKSDYCGALDICSGKETSLNQLADMFDCPIDYVDGRPCDVKKVPSNPGMAKDILGWEPKISIEDKLPEIIRNDRQ